MKRIHVVAGVLRDAQGRVLVAARAAGTHLEGLWEFPGGKVEPAESAVDALCRELHEEIGVDVVRDSVTPLHRVPWRYPGKIIDLDVHCAAFTGEPHGREGQPIAWHAVDELPMLAMPPADRPIITALSLPRELVITPEPPLADFVPFLAQLDALVERSSAPLPGTDASRRAQGSPLLVQLRTKRLSYPRVSALARAFRERTRAHGAKLVINEHVDLAETVDADGVHLPARVARTFGSRPIARERWLGVSCHDEAEIAQALRIDADYLVLGPVMETPSHPGQPPMGWDRFAMLVREVPVPVFALGGVRRCDLAAVRARGAFGVAGISDFWRSPS